MSNNRTCEVLLSDGERLRGPVHASWAMIESHPEVTTLDLHAAYKQLAISPSSRAFSVVVLSNLTLATWVALLGMRFLLVRRLQ